MDGDKLILLIEDNDDDVELTLRAFRNSGIANTIDVVRDGASALDYLLSGDEDRSLPTLVLLDLNLPKVDGHEVLRRIRTNERTSRLPVVILTSSREEADIVEAYQNGANSYVRKPVDFLSFMEAVQKLGLYWLIMNKPVPRRAGR